MKTKNKLILIGVLVVLLFFGAAYKIGYKIEDPKTTFLNYRSQVSNIKNISQLQQINKEYFSRSLMQKTEQSFNFEKLSEQNLKQMTKEIKNTLLVSGTIKNTKQEFDDKKTAELVIAFDSGKIYQVPFIFENNSWKFATFEQYPDKESKK